MEEIMNSTQTETSFSIKKEEEDKKKNCILWVLAIIGAVAAVAESSMGIPLLHTRTIWKI